VNEYSGRYSVMRPEFYAPEPQDIRLQSTVNKQGRSEKVVPNELRKDFLEHSRSSQKELYGKYEQYVDTGLARELARINLPLSLYTEWYWKIDLHNLFHFLRLRMDSHAQKEIQVYANVMAEMVRTVCPMAFEAFIDYTAGSENFSCPELKVIKSHLDTIDTSIETLVSQGLSKREAREFIDKLSRINKLEEK